MGAVSLAGFLAVFRPWGHRMRVPFSYGQDNLFYAMLVRTMILYGGYGYSATLGAPHGQELYDFPLGPERLHLLLLKALTLFSHDPILVLNLFYGLTFVLIAMSAFVVLRHLGIRTLIAGCASVLYAFLPYHHWHGIQHPPLSAYYAVPLGVLLALWVFEGGIPFPRSTWREWPQRERRIRLIAIVAMALVIGSASPYYAIFGFLMIAGSGALRAARGRSLKPLLAAGAACGLVVVIIGLNIAPELKFRFDHGDNPQVANRPASESEAFGLHITQMLLPYPDYRIPGLRAFGNRASQVNNPGEGGSYLGMVGVAGAVLAVGSIVWSRDKTLVGRRVRWMGALIVYATALGTVGGFGFLFAVLGFTQIRGWDRIDTVIAFLALATVALLVDRVWSRAPRRRLRLLAPAIVIITLFGLVEQTPSGTHPDYAAIDAVYQSDRAFFAGMESTLPAGAMVFELPVVPFPESPGVVGDGSYDNLRGYILGTGKLQWSAGGMRGRISDWQEAWEAQPTPRMIDGLAAAGFSALYVDSAGFTDNGVSLLHAVEQVLGGPAQVSPNGRMRWYDLRPEADRLRAKVGADAMNAAGQAVVTSPTPVFGGAFSFEERGADGRPFRWMGQDGTITLDNLGAAGRTMSLRVDAVGPTGSHLTIRAPGVDQQIALTPTGAPIDVRISLPARVSVIEFTTDAPRELATGDVRDLRVRFVGLTLADEAIVRALGA